MADKYSTAQLACISKLGLNSKIKKFSYSFICGKDYSPPFGGENSFLSTVWADKYSSAEGRKEKKYFMFMSKNGKCYKTTDILCQKP